MNFDEEEIARLRKSGNRVKVVASGAADALKKAHGAIDSVDEEPAQDSSRAVVRELKTIAAAVVDAIKNSQEREITVNTPEMIVSPRIKVNVPKSWSIEVTERDDKNRIKSMTIKSND